MCSNFQLGQHQRARKFAAVEETSLLAFEKDLPKFIIPFAFERLLHIPSKIHATYFHSCLDSRVSLATGKWPGRVAFDHC